jgi:3',5'-cyclic AMP phosphodiesterase CpdA
MRARRRHGAAAGILSGVIVAGLGCAASNAAWQQAAPQPAQGQAAASGITLPNKKDSIRFAVLGDAGTGGSAQQRIANRLAATHKAFPFEFVIMLGDNLYGSEDKSDYEDKFERPYKPLLDAEVKFYASLGNHDDPEQRLYKLFNMNGERYYSFKPSPLAGVRFFALDTNYMDRKQLDWLEKELAGSGSDWKIPFFHHPIYSSGGRHGSDVVLREQLEPLFVKHGVQVVFTGHEHFYERIKPQKGITYIISGAAAKLRRGDIERSNLTAKGYDQGYTFMIVEIDGDQMHFQAITDTGRTVDSGSIHRSAQETNGAAKRPGVN